MDDLKELLGEYSEPTLPEGFTGGVMRRIERGSMKPANPLLLPGITCISCGLVLSLVLRTGLSEHAITLIDMIGRLLQ